MPRRRRPWCGSRAEVTESSTRTAVAFVLKGYPRLSETFIAQEILGLEQRGLPIRLYSLRHPTDPARHPVHAEIAAPVVYLPEYLHDEPLRVWRGWRRARRFPGFAAAAAVWRRDLARDRTRNRLRRFGQACVLAAELAPDVGALHAHFLHTPASVTRYAALIRGLPWSVAAHAKDVWTIPGWETREKLADCRFAVTCTRMVADHLRGLASDPERIRLAYHGLDFSRFPPPSEGRPPRAGEDPDDPVLILSVGRAVAKKGYDVLLEALARLPAGLFWRFVHIGGGELHDRLAARAAALGIADRVSWLGPLPQSGVLAWLRAADLFALAACIAADGDRDGLPNVLMEAQSQELACVASRVAAIPELIDDGVTGLLVPPGDPAVLAAALARLIQAPLLRQRLGTAGAARVRTGFAMSAGLDRLAPLFGLPREPDSGDACPLAV